MARTNNRDWEYYLKAVSINPVVPSILRKSIQEALAELDRLRKTQAKPPKRAKVKA